MMKNTNSGPIRTRAARGLLLACAVLALAACATPGAQTHPVVGRAEARWAALTSGDLETAYTYYSPGYRSSTSLVDFGVAMRARKVQWSSATYKEHECEESRCTVSFDLAYRVPRPVPGLKVWESTSVIRETWVKVDGQWWYLPEK
jgi:hypothetical protein